MQFLRFPIRYSILIFTGKNQYQVEGKKGRIMKPILNIVAILLIIAGGVWFLQGINLLPGSFMTGQIRWAIYGGIAILAGIGIAIWNNRRKTL
jgi:hypothetical protein